MNNTKTEKILCVDLDGTFTQGDMLYENFVYCFFRNPLIIFYCIFWLLYGGKNLLKKNLAKSYKFDPSILPINVSVKKLILSKKQLGYKVFLISASTDSIVKFIYEYYKQYFDGYYATNSLVNGKTLNNLRGINKATFIVENFKSCYVEYVGNSKDDIDVWNNCNKGYAVCKKNNVFTSNINLEFLAKNSQKTLVKNIVIQLRLYQWVKNILILLPLVASHQILSLNTYFITIISVFAFSLITSTVYIFNDLLDLENDRANKIKKNRPLASGDLSIALALFLSFFCFSAGSIIAYLISSQFLLFAYLYVVFNIFYSLRGKQIIIFDCILLSFMYTFRIFLGIIIASLNVSVWLMSFSFFLFLSLSFIKRYVELYNVKEKNNIKIKGRSYIVDDMQIIISMSICSGFLSVLILDIYFNQEEIKETFKSIWYAYFCLPALLYWLARIFIKTVRGNMNEDPVVFAIKDKGSLMIGFFFICFFLLAAFL